MVRIRLNGKEYSVPEGTTVLGAAREAGFPVPSLCHNDHLPHYTSCMVCMVKDNRAGRFFASCSVQAEEGMDIDVSSEEVISLRKRSLELLLSEHRAECEAPCKVVCPAGYNIPLFNRFLAGNDTEAAVRITRDETIATGIIACTNCSGYCENACRRKKIDLPVSIRNMKLFIFSSFKVGEGEHALEVIDPQSNERNKKAGKRFNSLTGKIEAEEQAEWLKECDTDPGRHREMEVIGDAGSEASYCMHCDCRAANDCRLRDLADEFAIKDPRGKLINAPIVKKINHTTGLIFENAKCIKCGLCVRICEEYDDEPSLCFINRGFISIISEPLTESFDSILIRRSREVIDICPTGALSKFKE